MWWPRCPSRGTLTVPPRMNWSDLMFDGVASDSTAFAAAIANLKALNIPDYVVAALPQPWNLNGATTNELVRSDVRRGRIRFNGLRGRNSQSEGVEYPRLCGGRAAPAVEP